MGRSVIEINLHGYTLQELKDFRNRTENPFERGILATIILRCKCKDNKYISSDCVIYDMDETYVRLESQNRRSWSIKGVSPILEKLSKIEQ